MTRTYTHEEVLAVGDPDKRPTIKNDDTSIYITKHENNIFIDFIQSGDLVCIDTKYDKELIKQLVEVLQGALQE